MYKHLDTHNAIPGPYFHGEHESATEIVVQGFVYLQSAEYCFPNNIECPLLPLQAGIARSPSPSACTAVGRRKGIWLYQREEEVEGAVCYLENNTSQIGDKQSLG